MNSPAVKVFVIIGTRPEAIKLAPVVKKLQSYPEVFHTQVCTTAQHREMLDQVLNVFAIRPTFDLNLMTSGQTPGEFASRALAQLETLFREQRPDLVVVQGDTMTSFVAALAGFYNYAKIAHVEAGLRSFDKAAPFPEEINRILTSSLADLHFAPTITAQKNLLREGVPAERVHVTGNTVVDAVKDVASRLVSKQLFPLLAERFPALPPRFVLVTAHRREIHGEHLKRIFGSIRELTRRLPEFEFLFPVHPNPKVRRPAHEMLDDLPTVHLLPPIDYVSFVWLMQHCSLILSDSGGIQEEAPSLGKRVLVMRKVTERPEGISHGFIQLVGTRPEDIIAAVMRNLQGGHEHPVPGYNPYGDGHAAERIVGVLRARFEPTLTSTTVSSEIYVHGC